MPDNDFEKQVYKKTRELKLLPSKAVWEQVEIRLSHKEKRRRRIIWYPFLLAGICLGGYLASHYKSVLPGKQLQTTTDKSYLTKINSSIADPLLKKTSKFSDHSTPASLNKDTAKKTIQQIIKTLPDKETGKNIITIVVKPEAAKRNHSKIMADQSSNYAYKSIRGYKPTVENSGDYETRLQRKDTAQQHVIQQDVLAPSYTKETVRSLYQGASEELVSSAVNKIATVAGSINTSLISMKNSPVIKINIKHQYIGKGWNWGLTFQAGRTSLSDATFGNLFKSNNLFDAASANQSSNGMQPVSNVFITPNSTGAAIGFSAGAFMKKNLSRRFAISLGMNYTFYSTSTTVGNKIDSIPLPAGAANLSSFNRYFRIGSTGSYTSKYHYIELPFTLQTTLTGAWKLPLYWDVGFSLSRFIAGNALNFDNNTGIYFKDNHLINKTQVNFSTGFPVSLSSRKRFALQAGPQLQLGINKAPAYETATSKRFLFLGLKANLLHKK